MARINLFIASAIGSIGMLGATGCGGDSKHAGKAETPVPMVTFDAPVTREVTRYELFTGRTEPLEQVEIRARVNGYLKEINFQPGKIIEKDKPMFLIDPEPYKADLRNAEANAATTEADLANSQADLTRAQARAVFTKGEYERYMAAGSGASASEQQKAKSNFDEADATVRSADAKIKLSKAKIDEANAAVTSAKLNLGYCKIDAPITGMCGDKLVTEGNLITGGQSNTTLLTTIVAVEEMDIAFDVDENTYQRVQQAVRDGTLKVPSAGQIPAEAGIAVHGTGYPLRGTINFTDNKVDPKTGTIRLKARFKNPEPMTGKRLLTAGMYARVRIPLGDPVKATLVPDSALLSDQGISYLYLVGADNKAVRCDAVIGQLDGDLRIIESIKNPGDGKPRPLGPEDRVIVSGIQRVRAGMTVDPKPVKK